jgi:hypothetical protein
MSGEHYNEEGNGTIINGVVIGLSRVNKLYTRKFRNVKTWTDEVNAPQLPA